MTAPQLLLLLVS